MTRVAHKLLEKAERSIAAGESLVGPGHLEAAAGRAYYAMFYVAEALLAEQGRRFRKHGGVHSAFGEYFVKTGAFDQKYHRWLLAAFNKRITADYGVDAELSEEEVRDMLVQSREFLLAAKQFLGDQPAGGEAPPQG